MSGKVIARVRERQLMALERQQGALLAEMRLEQQRAMAEANLRTLQSLGALRPGRTLADELAALWGRR